MSFIKKILLICFLSGSAFTGSSQNYIFYLHGKIIENKGPKAVDEVNGYGAYEYYAILDSLKQNGDSVISEVRPKDTDVKHYALKVKLEIDSLLKMGIQPEKITVIGASKGASIAMYVSSYLKNKSVNFVFMAACYEDSPDSEINFFGNILSIYESSDLAGSCAHFKEKSKGINHYKEIQLHTDLRHGFLYKPLPEWVNPSLQWAKANYE